MMSPDQQGRSGGGGASLCTIYLITIEFTYYFKETRK